MLNEYNLDSNINNLGSTGFNMLSIIKSENSSISLKDFEIYPNLPFLSRSIPPGLGVDTTVLPKTNDSKTTEGTASDKEGSIKEVDFFKYG